MDNSAVPHQIRKVFEGRIFSVVVESITTEKGGKMDVEIVRHPGSVVILPVNERGELSQACTSLFRCRELKVDTDQPAPN